MNRNRVALMASLLAALAFSLAGDTQARADHKAAMDQAQDLKDEIQDNIDAKDAAKLTAAVDKLNALARKEVEFWTAAHLEDGVRFAKLNLSDTQALQAAAKKASFTDASAALDKVNGTCRSCHDEHFEKLLKN